MNDFLTYEARENMKIKATTDEINFSAGMSTFKLFIVIFDLLNVWLVLLNENENLPKISNGHRQHLVIDI